MNESIFIGLWLAVMLLGAFSSIVFFAVKNPEYTLNRLMEQSWGYWYKHLDQIVPGKWIRPIYWSAFSSAFIALAAVIYMVVSNV